MQGHHNALFVSGAIALLLGSLIDRSHVFYMELVFVLYLVVVNHEKIGQLLMRASLHLSQKARRTRRP